MKKESEDGGRSKKNVVINEDSICIRKVLCVKEMHRNGLWGGYCLRILCEGSGLSCRKVLG